MFSRGQSMALRNESPAGSAGGVSDSLSGDGPRLRGLLFFHRAADVDEIVSDHAESDPAFHSDEALVAATIETVSPLDDADASLASGPPFLAVAEPALLLFAFALRVFVW